MGHVFDDFDINLDAEVNTQVKKNGGKSRREGSVEIKEIATGVMELRSNGFLEM